MKRTIAAFVLLAASCAHRGGMKIEDQETGNVTVNTTNSPTNTTSSMTMETGNSDYQQCLQDYAGYAKVTELCEKWIERWPPADSTACAEPCSSTLTQTPYYR